MSINVFLGIYVAIVAVGRYRLGIDWGNYYYSGVCLIISISGSEALSSEARGSIEASMTRSLFGRASLRHRMNSPTIKYVMSCIMSSRGEAAAFDNGRMRYCAT